jgi:hypothetical protein
MGGVLGRVSHVDAIELRLLGEETRAKGQADLILDLARRTVGRVQEVEVFGLGGTRRSLDDVSVESLTDQFTVLSEDYVRVDPEVWERAGRAINQRERLRLQYPRFDGVTRDYVALAFEGALPSAQARGRLARLAICLPSEQRFAEPSGACGLRNP